MSENNRLPWPIWAVMLDAVGTLLLAAGLYGTFGGDDLALSEVIDLHAIGIPLIIVGILLIGPFLAYTISHARKRR